MTDFASEYKRRHDAFLRDIAGRLCDHVQELLRDQCNIDRVSARAKDPEHFAKKAEGLNENGTLKYSAPFTEMQDLLGVRVVVFYKSDVAPIDAVIQRYFRPIEDRELVPDNEWKFGYFGRHLVLPVPLDVVPESVPTDEVPRFFELQIKTLFQHAWSEAEHDIGYKAPRELTTQQTRQLAFTAAQAWGADEIFDQLQKELLADR